MKRVADNKRIVKADCQISFARPWRKAHKSRTPRPRAEFFGMALSVFRFFSNRNPSGDFALSWPLAPSPAYWVKSWQAEKFLWIFGIRDEIACIVDFAMAISQGHNDKI